MTVVPVVIFTDFTCPFSYVTEAALRQRAERGGIEVEYRAFELFPAPAPLPQPEVPAPWEAPLRPLADAVGLRVHAREHQPRTRKAHETARFASDRGAADRMRSAIYAAYWEDGRDIGRIDVLVGVADGLGLDTAELRVALGIDQYADQVMDDRATGLRLGVTGVPALVAGSGTGAQVLVGARTYDEIDAAIARSR